jgi:hypothetical protein
MSVGTGPLRPAFQVILAVTRTQRNGLMVLAFGYLTNQARSETSRL